jgi:predicted acyl esterase
MKVWSRKKKPCLIATCALVLATLVAPTSAHAQNGDPWPTGHEWPAGVHGPFPVRSVERLFVPSWDGTRLAGWLWRPALPPGVRAPVVLWSGPYHAGLDAGGGDPDDAPAGRSRPAPVERLVSEGYAVAVMSVRGTGESGGCVDMWGRSEQRDQALLVVRRFKIRPPSRRSSRCPASETTS